MTSFVSSLSFTKCFSTPSFEDDFFEPIIISHPRPKARKADMRIRRALLRLSDALEQQVQNMEDPALIVPISIAQSKNILAEARILLQQQPLPAGRSVLSELRDKFESLVKPRLAQQPLNGKRLAVCWKKAIKLSNRVGSSKHRAVGNNMVQINNLRELSIAQIHQIIQPIFNPNNNSNPSSDAPAGGLKGNQSSSWWPADLSSAAPS